MGNATTIEYSDTVLEETLGRSLHFLDGSTYPPIAVVLEPRGYSEEARETGWELLTTAAGRRRAVVALPGNPVARKALAEVDAWDEPNFAIANAALAPDFPEQRDFLFQDLEPGTGAWALVTVTTFLNRADELENSKERKDTRKQDHAALAKLAERGITQAERARLRGLIAQAQKVPSVQGDAQAVYDQLQTDRKAALTALRSWYNEWATVARALIKRRDYLIRLGLAQRKVKKSKKGDATEVRVATK